MIGALTRCTRGLPKDTIACGIQENRLILTTSRLASKKTSKHKKIVHPIKKIVVVKRDATLPKRYSNSKNESLFRPLSVTPVKKEKDVPNVGEELAGKLNKASITTVLKQFILRPAIKVLAAQQGLEGELFHNAYTSFRRYCLEDGVLPVELHIVFSDILAEAGHVDDLFPFFLNHAKEVFPHLDCMDDLKKISDLTEPTNWYPLARSIERKIIFHAGPTNSGKTYHALKRFTESDSGVYCGPLRLLAMEVFDKSNEQGTPCDLVTGETRRFANGESASNHMSCTVEMLNINQEFDVAVIDEIQMIGDPQRGWSWTRALLGVAAKEVHVCGEETAIELVQKLMEVTGDVVEVRNYKRLTSLTYQNSAVCGFDKIKAGDCIVCFSKQDIFSVSQKLESLGHTCAVIYGGLPPGTKIMQSKRFNDPNDPCNVLVATDAVGMGLNLAIKRVIFYSLLKPNLNEEGVIEIDLLTTSQAQQIGGRAGRFRTQYEDGEVTTFKREDLKTLKTVVNTEKSLLQQAGLNPSSDQIEMFAYHLPKASLSNLLDIFTHVSQLDGKKYFMCNLEQFKDLADLIEHLPLPLRTRYTFCSSPLKVRKGFASAMFIKLARHFSMGLPMSFTWLCQILGAPFSIPKSLAELERLEGVFDVIDLYLWLSYRFPDMFLDTDEVRELRIRIDAVIQTFLNTPRDIRHRGKKQDFSNLIKEAFTGETVAAENALKRKNKQSVVNSDLSEKNAEVLDKNTESEIAELIENNPLQAYMPKPKNEKTDFDQKADQDLTDLNDIVDSCKDVNLVESMNEEVDQLDYKVQVADEVDLEVDLEASPSLDVDGLKQIEPNNIHINQIENFAEHINETLEDSDKYLIPQISENDVDIQETAKGSYSVESLQPLEDSNQELNEAVVTGLDVQESLHDTNKQVKHLYDQNPVTTDVKDDAISQFKNYNSRQSNKPKFETVSAYPKTLSESRDEVEIKSEENGSNNFFSFAGMKIIKKNSNMETSEKQNMRDNGVENQTTALFRKNESPTKFAKLFKRFNKAEAEIQQTACEEDDKNINDNIVTEQGKLTKKLLQDGLLSKDMLEKLQKEWESEMNNSKKDDSEQGTNDGR